MKKLITVRDVHYALLFYFIVAGGSPAWAVQQHGGAEGLVSHQIGHLLFIAGTISLLIRIYYERLTGPGWLEFKWFLRLIVLWNFLTFGGHWLREFIETRKFIVEGGLIVGFHLASFVDFIFYLSRLDHLLLVPGLLFLLAALKRWRLAI